MSAQPRTTPGIRRNPYARGIRPNRHLKAATAMVPARLSWITPPRLGCDLPTLCAGLQSMLDELSPESHRCLSAWYLAMLDLNFVKPCEVEPLLTTGVSALQWHTLYFTTLTRLVDALNATARRFAANAYDSDDSLRLTLEKESDPALLLSLSGYYVFNVSSLHHLPAKLADWVNEGLTLIADCLVYCLLPAEMWDGSELGWTTEDYREEYVQLRNVGGLNNLTAALKLAQEEPFDYFSGSEPELRAQLEYAHEMFEGRPAWMTPNSGEPIDRAQRLLANALGYRAREPAHPWVTFLIDACRVLRKRFPSPREFEAYSALYRQQIRHCEEGERPLFFGLWVDSGSDPEHHHAEVMFEDMGNAGEIAAIRLGLTDLAGADLWRILENTAIGLGLLLRANAVNLQLLKETA